MIEIKKPITLLREDFALSLVELCNNSGLPYFIMEGILIDVLNEVRVAGQKQLESDRKKYEEAINKSMAQETNIGGE